MLTLNDNGRNYFFADRTAFEAFVGEQSAKLNLAAVQDAITEKYGEAIPAEGVVIFEYTNDLGLQAPKEVKPRYVVTSQRKIGPRKQKAEAPATDAAPATESGAPAVSKRTRKPAATDTNIADV